MPAQDLGSLVAAHPALRRVGRTAREAIAKVRRRGVAAKARMTVREDPIPTTHEFPDASYVILVGGIPRHYAGRTASILTKTRLWYERAGVRSTVVTMFSSGELDDLSHQFEAKGASPRA